MRVFPGLSYCLESLHVCAAVYLLVSLKRLEVPGSEENILTFSYDVRSDQSRQAV